MNKTLDLDKHKIMQFLVCGYRSIFKKRKSFFLNLNELPPATNLKN